MAKATKKADVAPTAEAENRKYEIMFILKPDLLEAAVSKKLKDFDKFLKEHGAEVLLQDIWGKRNLAYRIKQNKDGIYVVYNVNCLSNFLRELDDHLRIDNETIRHLIIQVGDDYEYVKFSEEEIEEAPKRERKPAMSSGRQAPKPAPIKEVRAEKELKEEAKKAEAPADGADVTAEPSTPEGGQAGDAVETHLGASQDEAKEEKPKKKPKKMDKSALDDKLDKILGGDDLNL